MISVEELTKNLEARQLVIQNNLKRLESESKNDASKSVEDKKYIAINIVQLSAQLDVIQQILFEINQ